MQISEESFLITYTDYVGLLMSSVTTIVDVFEERELRLLDSNGVFVVYH